MSDRQPLGDPVPCPWCQAPVVPATTIASPAGPGGAVIHLDPTPQATAAGGGRLVFAVSQPRKGRFLARILDDGEQPDTFETATHVHPCPSNTTSGAHNPHAEAATAPPGARHTPPGVTTPGNQVSARRRARGARCDVCKLPIVWYRSPHTGTWRPFDPTPLPPGDTSGRVGYPVEGRRAWKTRDLIEDLQTRRACTPAEAEAEVADLPRYALHHCPHQREDDTP